MGDIFNCDERTCYESVIKCGVKRIGREGYVEYDPFESMCCAIVDQAAVDYVLGALYLDRKKDYYLTNYGTTDIKKIVKQINKNHKLKDFSPSAKKRWRYEIKMALGKKGVHYLGAIQFFKSEWCYDLCGIDGDFIFNRLKSMNQEEMKDFLDRHGSRKRHTA